MSTLADVTVLVTSFLREGCLVECMRSLRDNLPEVSVIVVDDSDVSVVFLAPEKTQFCRMPFDSGLSSKRNAGVRAVKTPYTLLGCDDFMFDAEARKGIELMIEALDNFSQIDIAAGRVDGRPYEGFIEYVKCDYIKETRANFPDYLSDGDVQIVDLTVNYFLARTEVLKQYPWPDSMKIGGEHICLFLDLKLGQRQVGWVKGANIKTQPYDPSKQDPRYAEFRARARSLGHPLMKKRYNIQKYIGFEGDVS